MTSWRRLFVVCITGLSLVGVVGLQHASAAQRPAAGTPSFVVYAGYADCPSLATCSAKTVTNPNFPDPWFGSAGVQFVGAADNANPKVDEDPDVSAIRVDNTGKSSLTISDVSLTKCPGTLDLWGTKPFKYPYTVGPGAKVIFSATVSGNFDGSESCSPDESITVDVNGVRATYADKIANKGKGAIVGGGSGTPFGDESTPWTKLAGGQVAIVVVPASLPEAKVGASYAQVLGAQDSNGKPTFSVSSGSLPPGLKLTPYKVYSAAAELIGKPTKAGTYSFAIRVTDTAKPQDVGTQTYRLQVKS